MRGKLPAGWKLEPGPAGTGRIVPGPRGPRSSGLMLVAAGLGCCVLAGVLFVGLSRGAAGYPLAGGRGQRLTLLLPLGLFLVGYGAWVAFGREEWRVDADLLEVTQIRVGRRRVRRFRGATLQLVSSGSGAASPAQRSLARAARAGAGSPGHGSWWGLFVADRSGKRCLYSSSRRGARPEEIRALGEFLSERTGWPLLQPRQRRKR